jgi:hypothetical protein
MPRLSRETWADIRAEREAGASFGDLATKYGVDKAAIHRRAKAEKWSDGTDVADVIRRKVNEKVNAISTEPNAKKRAEAIEAAADRAAEIVRLHQEETKAARERLYSGLRAHKAAATREDKVLAFEDLKAAKIASEVLSIIQRLERINWGLEDASAKPEIVIERSYGK